MHSLAVVGAFSAMVLGLTTGIVLKPGPGDGDERPKGPQQIFSSAHAYASAQPTEGWWTISAGNVGDWVYGTDWVHPKDPPAIYEEPAPTLASLDQPQPSPQDAGQPLKISLIDDQGRGQIDDAAHRPDPGAQLGETAAEGGPLHRTLKLDDADGAADPNVGDAGQPAAAL